MSIIRCQLCGGLEGRCARCGTARAKHVTGRCSGGCRGTKRDWVPCGVLALDSAPETSLFEQPVTLAHAATVCECDGCGERANADYMPGIYDRAPVGWLIERAAPMWAPPTSIAIEYCQPTSLWCPRCASIRATTLDYAVELCAGAPDSIGAMAKRAGLEARLIREAVDDVLEVGRRVLTSEGYRALTRALTALGELPPATRVQAAAAKALEIPF